MDEATFLTRVKPLFLATVDREGEAYDDVIYRVERPLRKGLVARVAGFLEDVGVDRGADGKTDGAATNGVPSDPTDATPDATVDEAVAHSHYPDTSPLLELERQGYDLPLAVGLLHFYQPSYPLYREEAVEALQALGRDDVEPYRTDLTEEGLAAYRSFEQAVRDLTLNLRFRHTPEIHYYRQRVVEGALVEAARGGA